MRVAIVSRIYRPEPSAASFFLGSVSDRLQASGHTVEVVTTRPPRALRSNATAGERIRAFPVLRDANGYVRGYAQYMSFDIPLVFRLLIIQRPDVLLVEPPPTTGAVVRLVCYLRRIPYVYDAADIWSDAASGETNSQIVLLLLRRVERFALRGARRIVTISRGVAMRLESLGVHRSVAVTGFGADTASFYYSPQPLEKTFLYAGSYSAWHGAIILVEAFAAFSRTHPGYRLRFVGNSTEREKLESHATKLGIVDSVDFQDSITASELQPLLAGALASLATLLPGSSYEYAFTTKVYSSLASGCPVIFAGPGPTGPFVTEASTHVSAGEAVNYDVADIARAMCRIADNPTSREERQRTARWTRDNHSMEAVADRVCSELELAAKLQ